MATVFSDWIGESTPTTGTGDITLGGSLQGFAPMAAAGMGEIYYTIVDGINKETGLGHYNGTTGFTRTTIIATLIDNVHTPSGAPLDLSGSAQIYGTVNSGTMKDIYARLASGDADTDEIYVYIDEQISDVNDTITMLDNQINNKVDNLGPDDVGAYPRVGGDVTGPAVFKNSDSGIHIDGGSAATGTAGDFRYNPLLGVFEGYFNGKWRNVGGGTGVVWAPTAVSVNPAEVGKGYLINATGLTITLPAAPEAGNSIGIGDYNGQNFTATVARNGKPIMGVAEDFIFNVKNANIVLSFVDNTIGWVLTQGFGESSVPLAIMNKAVPAVAVGQTVFSFPNFGTDSVDVYYNGKKLLRTSDYIADNIANTVTLAKPVSLADDIVELYNWNQAAVIHANKISYDNTTSKVPATTMQGAIDNLAQMSNPNKLINGGMRIAQRGATVSVPSGGSVVTYTLDRWAAYCNGAGLNCTAQQASAVGAPMYYLQMTGAAGNTSNNLQQRIEALNCVDMLGEKVTVSFKVYGTNAPASITAQLLSANAKDNFTATTVIQTSTPFVITPLTAWSDTYSFTFNVLPSAILNGLVLLFNIPALPAGTNFIISEVKLEIGDRATRFEYPDISEEIRLCQRYYEKSYDVATAPATSGTSGCLQSTMTTSFFLASGTSKYAVNKRAQPAINIYSPQNGAFGTLAEYNSGSTFVSNRAAVVIGSGEAGFFIQTDGTAVSGNAVRWHWTASAEL